MAVKVLLDTNFIITCARQKIHFEDKIKDLIPDAEILIAIQVRNELTRVMSDSEAKIVDREAASLGLQLIDKFEEIDIEGDYVDKGLLDYCESNDGCVVATIDKELKKKLKDKARVIYIRNLKNLELS